MALIQPELDTFYHDIKTGAPPNIVELIDNGRQHASKFDFSNSINQGDRLPEFELPNAAGQTISSVQLLQKGPLVITFYRGEWCPFCNITISGFQKHLAEFKSHGVDLVAITPELPDGTLTMTEKHDLQFTVLSDVHNNYARKLGIVWKEPDSFRTVHDTFEHHIPKRNGDESFELPLPVTLLVDQKGTVRNIYRGTDWTKRVEPKEVLEWIKALN